MSYPARPAASEDPDAGQTGCRGARSALLRGLRDLPNARGGAVRSAVGEPTVPPGVLPRPVAAATAAVFGGLAALRRERSMHGPGVAFRGRVEMVPPHGLVRDAPFFQDVRTYDATIRFSRGIGLPQPAADLLGIAVRAHDADGAGGDQDLLVTSSGGRRVTRRLLLPARDGFFGQWFSSVLPHRVGGLRTVLGVHAVVAAAGHGTDVERLRATRRQGPLTFVLALAVGDG